MAATVRFDDGALELEAAGDPRPSTWPRSTAATAAPTWSPTLPDDTAAALGVGLRARAGSPTSSTRSRRSPAARRRRRAARRSSSERPASTCPPTPRPCSATRRPSRVGSRLRPRGALSTPATAATSRSRVKVKGDPDGSRRCSTRSAARPAPTRPSSSAPTATATSIVIGPNADYRARGARGRRPRRQRRLPGRGPRGRPGQRRALRQLRRRRRLAGRAGRRRPRASARTSSRWPASASRLDRRRRRPRGAAAHHRLTASAGRCGGDRPGDRDQVGRGELEVEPAPARRDVDRVVLERASRRAPSGARRFWPTARCRRRRSRWRARRPPTSAIAAFAAADARGPAP